MAEEDWTFVPKVSSNKWQEEETEDIKDNWDDDDEDEPSKSSSNADSTSQQAPQQPAQSSEPKTSGKKKSKALKEKIKEKEMENRKPKTAEELLAEKLEQQRLVEEGDLALAKETFGVSTGTDSSVLNSIRLATKEDFEDFRKALTEKLNPFVRSPHYITFLENLFRSLASGLDSDDIKKLNTTLNALYNEKIKLQKTTKGKKSKKVNAEIRLERDDDYSYNQLDHYENEYEDFFG